MALAGGNGSGGGRGGAGGAGGGHVVLTEGRPLTPETLAAAFTGEFKPVRLSPMYQLSLLVVAVVMLFMPLAYLALIALTGYGVLYHATENFPDFGGGARTGRGAFILYIAPLLAGSLVFVFLLKPFFAPRRKYAEPLTVQPDQEPLLTQYVELVCRVMNAPVPKRIDVDAQANASASFRRGLLSFFGNDLVLTLGLPLVAAMDLRQLTGVLAHELGHFRQGTAMRLTLLIHRVNGWFARVVYERDAWDFWLEDLPRREGMGYITVIVLFARLCIAVTRVVLWALMHGALAVSSFMSRQMEFDADRCQARMAGSAAHAPTSRRIMELATAWEIVASQLPSRWAERRLPDDLPRFVATNAANLRKEAREAVDKILADRKGRLFSTHPPMARRIGAAERLEEPGLFGLDLPAWAVFRDFQAVCRHATYIHYRLVVGEEIFQATLVPTAQVLDQQESESASGDAFVRFFPGSLASVRPIFPKVLEITSPRDAKDAAADLRDARTELELRLPEFEETVERFVKAAEKVSTVRISRDLVGAGLKVRARDVELPKATSETLREAIKVAEEARESVLGSLEPGIAAARRRLVSALRLLHVSGIDKRLPEAKAYRERIPALLLVLGAMSDCQEQARQLRIDNRALITLINNARGNEKNELFFPRLRDVAQRVQRGLNSVLSAMSVTEYPYQHSRGAVSIAEILRTGVPANPDYPIELAENVEAALAGILELYFRVMAELAAMAEKVEKLLKLPPIEAPASYKAKVEAREKAKGKKKKKKAEAAEELQPV